MIEEVEAGCVRHQFTIPARGNTGILFEPGREASRALMTLGEAIFEFEKYLRKVPQHRLEIAMEKSWTTGTPAKRIKLAIERLLSYVLLSDIKVALVPKNLTFQLTIGVDDGHEEKKQADAVCLFSGGVDSLSGILVARERYRNLTGVFCSHLHQTRVVALVRKMKDNILAYKAVSVFEIPVPGIEVGDYAQTRGFLYMLAAASVAAAVGSDRVIISECGPTMYQPRFSPADGVTMTTHPYVLARAQDVINAIASRRIRLETPFDNMTKAEVMAVCPKADELAFTHSCVSQRLKEHDGTCYGCVVRRLAAVAASVPDTVYARDPITDESSNSGNLLSLLEFCANLLIDLRTLPNCQTDLIDQYDKWDLFQRFALDNFAALYRLTSNGVTLTSAVNSMYKSVVKGIGGTTRLKERLEYLGSLSGRGNAAVCEMRSGLSL